MRAPTDVAAAFVRTWTRAYTWRMTPELRESRLAEIESDLWELSHDRERRGVDPALHMIVRLLMGVPSDLCWRIEQAALESEPVSPRAVMTAALALAAALWILPVWYARGDSNRATVIEECADRFESDATTTASRADYRLRVIACAGRFFASRKPTAD